MRSFYRQGSAHLRHLSRPVVGQLVAIRAEQGDELARGQVQELLAAGVKVRVREWVGRGLEVNGQLEVTSGPTSSSNMITFDKCAIKLLFTRCTMWTTASRP